MLDRDGTKMRRDGRAFFFRAVDEIHKVKFMYSLVSFRFLSFCVDTLFAQTHTNFTRPKPLASERKTDNAALLHAPHNTRRGEKLVLPCAASFKPRTIV